MKPRLHASLIITAVLCITMGFLSFAQEGPPASFVVEDLQLISLASKPEWDNDWEWSRAVEAATILAWLHDHGYALLLGDLNEDGVIDELDTIELAGRLGKHPMGCDTPRHPTDAWLVLGLAEYVADKYPDIFELKIYDRGFPSEFERKMGRPFTPDAIPGIILTLESEPTFAAYMKELVEEEGVILGLEEEPGRNLYFAGRSFLRDPIAPNIHGIDLVWAQEDWYEPGMQGKVLETRARQTDAFYVDYQGGWMKVESMLALSPLYPPGEGPAEACPDLIVVGSAVCECSAPCWVTVDATVYNIGAGEVPGPFHLWLTDILCEEGPIPDQEVLLCGADIDQINATGSVTVQFTYGISSPSEPCPTCTYTLVVDSQGEVDESCYPAPWGEFNNAYHGTVCCDGEPLACPDLTIEGLHLCRCWKTETGHVCEVLIKATITNIAPGVPVGPFGVGLLYGCTDGGGPHPIGKVISGTKLDELNDTGSTSVGFWYVFATTDPTSPCCEYVLVVDFWNAVDESCHPHPNGEHNNLFFSHFCCETPPEDGRCPDLTISGEQTCTCTETPEGVLVCDVDINAFVGKAGGPVSDSFEVRLTIDCDDALPSQEQWKMVDPGQINDGFEMVHFDYLFAPLDPMNPCCTYSLEVDRPDVIDETCFIDGETNNTFSPGEFCCDGTTQDCPDLMIAVDEAICTCGPPRLVTLSLADACTVTVYGTVTNIGGAPILNSFDVAVDYGCADGTGDFLAYTIEGSQLAELNAGSTTVEFTWLFTPLEEDFNCCHFVLIVDSGGEIEECPPWGEMNNVAGGMVCCEVPTQECPDLTVTGSHSCSCRKTKTGYFCNVHIKATVTNIAPEVPVVGSFGVGLVYVCSDGGGPLVLPIIGPTLDELNTTGSTSVEFSYEFATTDPTPPCCEYDLIADFYDVIDESCHPHPNGEDNNTFTDRFCCEELPGCPDIVIEITRTSCDCEKVPIRVWHPGGPAGGQGWWETIYETECAVTVHYMVKNIGTQGAGEFHVRMESTTGDTVTTYFSGLLIGEEKNRWFDFTTDAPGSVTVTLIADNAFEVDECDEDNNTDELSIRCYSPLI